MSHSKLKKFIASAISVLYSTSCFGTNVSTEFSPDFMTKKVEMVENNGEEPLCAVNRFFVDPCYRLLLNKGISQGYVNLSPVFKDLYKYCYLDELCNSKMVIGLYDFLTFFTGFYKFCAKIENYKPTMKIEKIISNFALSKRYEYIVAKFDGSNDAYLLRYVLPNELKSPDDYWKKNQRFYSTVEHIGGTDYLCHNLHFLEDSYETFEPSIGADFGLFNKNTKNLEGCYTIVYEVGIGKFRRWDKLKSFLEKHPNFILVCCGDVSNNGGYYFLCAKHTGKANNCAQYHFLST